MLQYDDDYVEILIAKLFLSQQLPKAFISARIGGRKVPALRASIVHNLFDNRITFLLLDVQSLAEKSDQCGKNSDRSHATTTALGWAFGTCMVYLVIEKETRR